MSKKISLSLILFFMLFLGSFAQNKPIIIEDEIIRNQLNLYAINENLYDLDVLLTVRGTGFRQRGGRERLTRVPGASRVKIKTLIIERDKKPMYTYTIVVNDSLSRRVVRPESTKIKIDAAQKILVYTYEGCKACDTLFSTLDSGMYKYEIFDLDENPQKIEALKKYIPSIESITTPIVSLGGVLYTDIGTYDQLLEKLNIGEQ